MERRLIGAGAEHSVYLVGKNCLEPKRVVKVPKLSQVWAVKLFSLITSKSPAQVIKDEILDANTHLDGISVRVPHSRVFKIKGNYLISQEYVDEDHSILDLPSFLRQKGHLTLSTECQFYPQNFISHKGSVNLIDPTKVSFSRFLVGLGVLSRDQMLSFKSWIQGSRTNIEQRSPAPRRLISE